MNADRLVLPIVRQIGHRPLLSHALFRFAKYNPFDPRRMSWPYPVYDEMSGGQPVVYSRLFKDWTVFGYDEVLDVMRSPNAAASLWLPSTASIREPSNFFHSCSRYLRSGVSWLRPPARQIVDCFVAGC